MINYASSCLMIPHAKMVLAFADFRVCGNILQIRMACSLRGRTSLVAVNWNTILLHQQIDGTCLHSQLNTIS